MPLRHLVSLRSLVKSIGQEGLITLLLNSGPTLGPGRVVPYSPIKSLEFSLNQSGVAIQNVVVVALKEWLMKPGVLAVSMDPFGFY